MTASASPIRTIWSRPRSTIRQVVDNDPEYGVLLLTLLSGALLGVVEAFDRIWSDEPTLATVAFTVGALGGAVRGVFVLYLGAWILAMASRVAGGSAPSVEVRAAIAWGNAPLALGAPALLVLWGGGLLLDLGNGFFDALAAIFAVLLVWSYVLLVFGLGVVQNFSTRKSALIVLGVGVGLAGLSWAAVAVGSGGFVAALGASFLEMGP